MNFFSALEKKIPLGIKVMKNDGKNINIFSLCVTK